MNCARNCENLLNFVKVMPKILLVPFFSGHGVGIRRFQKCYSFRSTTKNNEVIVEKPFQNVALPCAWPSWIHARRQYILLVIIIIIIQTHSTNARVQTLQSQVRRNCFTNGHVIFKPGENVVPQNTCVKELKIKVMRLLWPCDYCLYILQLCGLKQVIDSLKL